jgi:hypothetical protein
MSKREEGAARGHARREIIESAQVQCYLARSECLRAKAEVGDVPEEFRREFQNAIVDYYWALRPMRRKPKLKDVWNELVLADGWVDPDEEEPIAGLDTIQQLDDITDTDTVDRHTMRGAVAETVTRQRVLPFWILKSISGTLDDAAAELGFVPDPPDDKSLPMITGFDQSGDEPQAGLKNAEYHRSPDI